MKYKILLFGIMAAVLTGCASTYKAGQTPDDVYYSPAREGGIKKETRNEDRYEDYAASDEDRYLRMKIRDRQRWSRLDDYSYWNDSRYMPSYSYDYYRNNLYNSYSWNNWNSPYFYSPIYLGAYNSIGYYNRPWGYSPYTNVYINKYPRKVNSSVNRPTLNGYNNRNYNNTNRQTLGNAIKRVLTTPENNSNYSNRNSSSNNSNNTYRAPERTYTPSSSGSSSSGSSSSGSSGGGVSRPPRN
jgi:hypothetical protein